MKLNDMIVMCALCDTGVFAASEIAKRVACDPFKAGEILDGLAATGRLHRKQIKVWPRRKKGRKHIASLCNIYWRAAS